MREPGTSGEPLRNPHPQRHRATKAPSARGATWQTREPATAGDPRRNPHPQRHRATEAPRAGRAAATDAREWFRNRAPMMALVTNGVGVSTIETALQLVAWPSLQSGRSRA